MDTNTQALDEIRRIASRWLTDLNTDAADAMRNIAGVLISGPTTIILTSQVNVGMDWDLVEQTTSRLADSMDAACHETSLALREDRIAALQAEVDRLRDRLEITADGGYDGIACRDETIRGQDEVIERLRAENKDLKRAIGAAQLAELFSDADEARIDVIGQNGNDGEHYAPQLSLGEVLAAAAPDEVAEAMAADDGWIEWKGHARPMVPFARVDLKLRDGSRLLGVKAGSYAWKWVHGHGDLDVIAYRLAGADPAS